MIQRRFIPSRLDGVENAEGYKPGGLHPISVGDTFAEGRYKIIHKLGYGGFSTIWMARDHEQHRPHGRLVALKVVRADVSSKTRDEIPELFILKTLRATLTSSSDLQTIEDDFVVGGPNGSHRVLVLPLAGPNVRAMTDCPGRTSGSRRLRGDLARRVAKQTATAIHQMHQAGFVHGDLTTSNILFRVKDPVLRWSDSEVYAHLGSPVTEAIRTRDGQPCGPHVPAELVAPIQSTKLADSSLLQERVVVIDFGQSYVIASQPNDYKPGTVLNYQPPEARFEGRVGVEADVWALACAIFEIRAGFPLFDSFFGSTVDILRQTVETLGRLPDPWWSSFENRALWFEEDGEPKSVEAQKLAGVRSHSYESPIREKLRSIGTLDDPPSADEGPMIEKTGVKLQEAEIEILGDLLDKMLKYRPEERIGMREVLEHPWFTARGDHGMMNRGYWQIDSIWIAWQFVFRSVWGFLLRVL